MSNAPKKKPRTAPARLPTGLRRLLTLADLLETLPRKRFDLGNWTGTDWRGKQDLSCGTKACAMGWAATIPSFRRAGLRLNENGIPSVDGVGDGFSAAERLFGITFQEARNLFSGRATSSVIGDRRLRLTATPGAVARNIRRFVKERSHAE